jgi:hypothetical protein
LPSEASLVDLGLDCPEGDAVAARGFADRLLQPVAHGRDLRDARLLLTSVCLYLTSLEGPSATVGDLICWFEAGQSRWGSLRDSPMQLLSFAYIELLNLGPASQSLALDLCLAAARLSGSGLG